MPVRYLICLFLFSLPAWGEVKTDVEFAKVGGVSLTLDAFVPEGKGPFPTVIVVHGGAFTMGDKQDNVKPLFEPLTQAGFTWFTINYRLAPKHRFPAAIEDVERAIRYVKAHAKEYKADPQRIALVGESAGGHLVSYVGVQNKPESRVAAVVAFYASHDFEARVRAAGTLTDGVKALLNVSEVNEETFRILREASPITHVTKGLPPFLLIHGTKDLQVPYEQSVKMRERLQQAANVCELFTVEGGGHGMGEWENKPEYKSKMVEWLKQVLK